MSFTKESVETAVAWLEGIEKNGLNSVHHDASLFGLRLLLSIMDSEPVVAVTWIPVSERLPEKGVDVLVKVKPGTPGLYDHDVAQLASDNTFMRSACGYCSTEDITDDVTHWSYIGTERAAVSQDVIGTYIGADGREHKIVNLSCNAEAGDVKQPEPLVPDLSALFDFDGDFVCFSDNRHVIRRWAYKKTDYVLMERANPSSEVIPSEMTPEMMRAVQLNSELGAYAAANMSGAYDLFREFWEVALRAAKVV